MLKLATELFTPIPERKSKPAAKIASATPASEVGPTRAGASGASARQLADAEFRRASRLVKEGKAAEGMDKLLAALSIDPSYELVRQTIVALQIEGRQVDAAASALREGLALNPANSVFAVLLARIMVERGDIGGALALMQKHEASGVGNAEFRAFVAALQQRLGRHKDAIDEYQAALRIAPGAGTWWVGLGISQEAASRPREAADAFRRARASGNLTSELIGFVDERLKLLQ
jgi:MSHA biogenesis protein MshN